MPTLVFHGSADDNVHLANTLAFVAALVKAGKLNPAILEAHRALARFLIASREIATPKKGIDAKMSVTMCGLGLAVP